MGSQACIGTESKEAGAHAALAIVEAIYYGHWSEARAHLCQIDPNEPNFQPYLFVLAAGFKFAPSGSSPGAVTFRALAQYLAGNAEAACASAVQPSTAEPSFWPSAFVRSLADGHSDPPSGICWSQGVIARRSPEEAGGVVKHSSRNANPATLPSSLFATAFLTQGDMEKAYTAFDRAAAERDPFLPMVLMDPALEPLRSEPRIVAVLHRLALPPGRAPEPKRRRRPRAAFRSAPVAAHGVVRVPSSTSKCTPCRRRPYSVPEASAYPIQPTRPG